MRDDFGDGADPHLQVPNMNPFVSKAKACLNQFPLAALDPGFNDIQPGEAF